MLAAAVIIFCWWFLIRKVPSTEVKVLSLLVIATLLLFPWKVPDSGTLAPAWIMVGMEMFSSGVKGFGRAGVPLVVALIAVVALSVGLSFFLRSRRSEPSTRDG